MQKMQSTQHLRVSLVYKTEKIERWGNMGQKEKSFKKELKAMINSTSKQKCCHSHRRTTGVCAIFLKRPGWEK